MDARPLAEPSHDRWANSHSTQSRSKCLVRSLPVEPIRVHSAKLTFWLLDMRVVCLPTPVSREIVEAQDWGEPLGNGGWGEPSRNRHNVLQGRLPPVASLGQGDDWARHISASADLLSRSANGARDHSNDQHRMSNRDEQTPRNLATADAEHVGANLTQRVTERSTASQMTHQLYQRPSNSPAASGGARFATEGTTARWLPLGRSSSICRSNRCKRTT